MFNRLYIHTPFCLEKCGYCAFASTKPEVGEIENYHELLMKEMRLVSAGMESPQMLDSIYFGGGTPSLLQPKQLAALIDLAAELFSIAPSIEITLEANPGTIDLKRLIDFKTTGINRLSLGVQSFDDDLLRCLGRIHDAAQALQAFRDARRAGFGNIGVDLIHALPGQTVSRWRSDLQETLDLSPEHLSIYGLTVEEGTPFAQLYPEESPEIPDQDLSAEMFELADSVLVEAGYEHYEIANYARAGYRSRHNCGYWRRDGYLGLGVAAHSLLRSGYGYRFSNRDTLEKYGLELAAGELPRCDQHQLSREDAMAEFMFLGLRLADGVSPEKFELEFGTALQNVYGNVLEGLLEAGLIEHEQGKLRLTRRGLLLSNQVFIRFLP